MNLEDNSSASLSIEDKKCMIKQKVMECFHEIFIEKPNIMIDDKLTDLFVLKGSRKIAIFFYLEDLSEKVSIKNKDDIICINLSYNNNIFQIMNELIKISNKKYKRFYDIHTDHTKYNECINTFWNDSIILSNHDILTKRELSSYFYKWCDTKCMKISSRILFSYMNEKVGIYHNGWRGCKLFYGITEEDFE